MVEFVTPWVSVAYGLVWGCRWWVWFRGCGLAAHEVALIWGEGGDVFFGADFPMRTMPERGLGRLRTRFEVAFMSNLDVYLFLWVDSVGAFDAEGVLVAGVLSGVGDVAAFGFDGGVYAVGFCGAPCFGLAVVRFRVRVRSLCGVFCGDFDLFGAAGFTQDVAGCAVRPAASVTF